MTTPLQALQDILASGTLQAEAYHQRTVALDQEGPDSQAFFNAHAHWVECQRRTGRLVALRLDALQTLVQTLHQIQKDLT